MTMSKRLTKSKVGATAILALALTAFVIFDEPSYDSNYLAGGRRFLQEETHRLMKETIELGYYSWAQQGLAEVETPPDMENEQPIFWYIPKSGGTATKSFYNCMGLNMEVVAQPPDILEAQDNGLVQSGKVDLLFSSYPDYATRKLFNGDHRGRMLATFRHPVERLISKFYYLGKADWERAYHPDWKDLSLLQWVERGRDSDDYEHHVKKLAGKDPYGTATEEDLELAKRTIELYFVVGLTDHLEESIKRFNVFLGVEGDDDAMDNDKRNELCMNSSFPADDTDEETTNSHPKADINDPGYQLLAEKNPLDIQLYEFIQELFAQQKAIIESHTKNAAANDGSDESPAQEGSTTDINQDLEKPPVQEGVSHTDTASQQQQAVAAPYPSALQQEPPMDQMIDEQYGNAVFARPPVDYDEQYGNAEVASQQSQQQQQQAAVSAAEGASENTPIQEGTDSHAATERALKANFEVALKNPFFD